MMPHRKEDGLPIVIAVFVTAACGVIVFAMLVDSACARYEQSHQMPTYIKKGWFGSAYEVQAQATFSMLDWATIIFTILLPALIYVCVHPLIGKLSVSVSDHLSGQIAEGLGMEATELQFGASSDLIVGSCWPIFVILIPLELLALLIITIYRSVWF
jgi:hypothetical protein